MPAAAWWVVGAGLLAGAAWWVVVAGLFAVAGLAAGAAALLAVPPVLTLPCAACLSAAVIGAMFFGLFVELKDFWLVVSEGLPLLTEAS